MLKWLFYATLLFLSAGLLQVYARSPRYASFKARLDSFPIQFCSDDSKSIAPFSSELASAGFFHTGLSDETICPACGLGLRDWQAADQPEACHSAYSTAAKNALEIRKSEDSSYVPSPTFPCLYLAVRRFLVSELPLARKFLVPVGSIQLVHTLPGVVSRPVIHFNDDHDSHSLTKEYSSFADRLRAIFEMMNASPTPQGWPVENARALGHSDDLIVMALWRLQADAAEIDLAFPSLKSVYVDPHDTAELLRAILRVQEGFDNSSVKNCFQLDFDNEDNLEFNEVPSDGSESGMTAEDAETAALSRCRLLRMSQMTLDLGSPHSIESYETHVKQRIRLPPFYQFLVWWFNRWSLESMK